ncbi:MULTISPECIES: protease SohB [Vibrio]|uniref:Protease SohB n=10 Tax=Vibrio TaxID=662 RepID=A0AAP3CXY9_9VIBR|nr:MULTISPECIES: protease SohB [Vibrio]EEZ83130.1 sohB protein, peptidase U7 family [Vibrio alginolyticus 40B]KOY44227.1 peptidase [Vibrio parahaemolyticus]MDW1969561.1 protease SohB [Vibrio sp. 945]MDW2294548.1 protease SohB [Vibrio sp. 1404]MEA3481846.1 protease SohB [Pseudomonadota bacterium]NAW53172.1 protease SohB [Vibrio sp. V41_P2S12T139]NAW92605.1 protease SohB [Vibrio sp. V42_P2S4T144]QCO86601.1 protease SohB [Vibrio neocaledonicus]
MEFLLDYGLFLAKIITVVAAIIVLLIIAKSAGGKSGAAKGELEITNLSEQHKQSVEQLEHHLHDDAFIKARDKAVKKEEKEKNKSREKEIKQASKDGSLDSKREPHLFVLDFNGSIDAKEVASLREEITAILAVAREGDEVLLRLESGGGMVHGYGLASSQLDRIKAAGLPLTISVDKVAASGGYMMACVADKIVSAPFAIVGSIGVIAQIPNFNKLLKKHDIEYEQLTAGEYKRTLTMFGENTDKARDKFKQELEETHVLFKDFIRERRPSLDLDKVATGEHWFGTQAKELGLVDDISTSDDIVVAACKDKTVLSVHYVQKKKLADKLAGVAGKVADSVILKLAERGQKPIV